MQNDFETLSNKEFLLTNGIGGYCSSSIAGANTRRYHGLLVAAFNPPTQRLVLVSKLQETVTVNGAAFELSSNQFPNNVHPQGYNYFESFNTDTNKAVWLYTVNNCTLQKTIEMVKGKNEVMVTYKNLSLESMDVQLMPLLVYRDYHALFYEQAEFNYYTELLTENYFKVFAKYEAHPLYIKITKGSWQAKHNWYKKFQYKQEQLRGFDYEEDAISIGKATIQLAKNEVVSIVFSTTEIDVVKPLAKLAKAKKTNFIDDLITSSRQFIVTRQSTNGSTVIAGYHWFTDWGRDTMIALRGISIATGKKAEAKSILQTFFNVIIEGMLPNRFPDYENDEVEYNTIDATLWLFVALYEYHQKFNDTAFVKKVIPQLKNIIEWHIKGTKYNIKVTAQGLLYGGEVGQQLTWMDARVNNFVVTPRIGCPVEINLLWYNSLCIYNYFSKEFALTIDKEFETLAKQTKESFIEYFVNSKGYLNDVVIPNVYTDDSIRPNQIYALSLPYSPLTKKQQQQVLAVVEKNLLTPYGLRTLDENNNEFKPIYQGDAWHRDNAYHQGTVWPFLWGEWAMAYLKVNNYSSDACKKVWNHSKPLQHHFYNEGCMFAIAEIFDGLQPNTGKGCVQQAWSIGNMLQVFLHPNFIKQ